MFESKRLKLASALGVLAVLLPAHPSLQEFFVLQGIPSVVVSFLLFFTAFISYGKLKVTNTFLLVTLLYLLFLIFITIGLLRSPSVMGDAWNKVVLSLFVVTPMVLICAFIASKTCQVATDVIQVTGFLTLIHVFIVIYSLDSFTGFISLNSDVSNPNYQATSFYLGLLAVGFIVRLSTARGVNFVLTLLIFISIIVVMSLVGARSVFIALLVVLVFVLLMLGKFRVYVFTSILILIVASLFVSYPEVFESVLIIQRFSALSGDDSSSRVFLFTSAIELWLSNVKTMVLGSGISYFPHYINANEAGWYPHNFILEILAEVGILGFLPLLLLLFLFFSRIRAVFSKNEQASITLFCYGLYSLVSYQFMGGLNSLWVPLFFVFLSIFSTARIRWNTLSD